MQASDEPADGWPLSRIAQASFAGVTVADWRARACAGLGIRRTAWRFRSRPELSRVESGRAAALPMRRRCICTAVQRGQPRTARSCALINGGRQRITPPTAVIISFAGSKLRKPPEIRTEGGEMTVT